MDIFYGFLGIDYDMTIYPTRRANQQNGYIGRIDIFHIFDVQHDICAIMAGNSQHSWPGVGKSPSNVAVDCPECHGGDYHSATGYPAW